MENAYVHGDYSFGDDYLNQRVDNLEHALKELLASIPYAYQNKEHGFKCPICKTVTPLPEQIPRHTDDCKLGFAKKVLDND